MEGHRSPSRDRLDTDVQLAEEGSVSPPRGRSLVYVAGNDAAAAEEGSLSPGRSLRTPILSPISDDTPQSLPLKSNSGNAQNQTPRSFTPRSFTPRNFGLRTPRFLSKPRAIGDHLRKQSHQTAEWDGTGKPPPGWWESHHKTTVSAVISGINARKGEVHVLGDRLWTSEDKRRKMRLQECITFAIVAVLAFIFGTWGYDLVQLCLETGSWYYMAALLMAPAALVWVLFSLYVVIGSIVFVIGPLSALKTNSTYYSCIPSKPPRKGKLPRVTIQMPVYKESLIETILPTIKSLTVALNFYREQITDLSSTLTQIAKLIITPQAEKGGEANIFINDDGLCYLSDEEAQDRRDAYNKLGVGFVARPKATVRIRRGRFKKASNMNYALDVSMKVEKIMHEKENVTSAAALKMVQDSTGHEFEAGGDMKMGEIILLVDSDTRVPQDCLYKVQGEFAMDENLGFLQCRTTPLLICEDNYFEKFIGHFTRIIYDLGIATSCAWGTISPLVGHNAFLRWEHLKKISWYDEEDKMQKFWSESHVSEDFDLSLRLFSTGHIGRYVTYTGPDFKEGVSLTVHDEITKLRKFAFGACEMIFNPVSRWLFDGIFTTLWKTFIFCSSIPWYCKFGLLGYLGTYLAMGAAPILIIAHYAVLTAGVVDDASFIILEPWSVFVTVTFIFGFAGTVGSIMWKYRLKDVILDGKTKVATVQSSSFSWPLLAIIRDTVYGGLVTGLFFSGLTYHMFVANTSYFLGLEVSWGSTVKELGDGGNLISETKQIFQRYWPMFLSYGLLTGLWLVGLYLPELSGWDKYSENKLIAVFPWLNHMIPALASVFLLSPACIKLFY